jgi:hypothetical protein
MRPDTIAQWQNRAVGIYLSLQGILQIDRAAHLEQQQVHDRIARTL